ncbi:helix-hairpin-helix domain-containing protein [Streptococcus massiliensis]|uniref:Putative competance protein n=1 Tax=Streptococcus massiliensis TaxID=313439 RepID=A0A380L0S3_9STRE|nr:helix-hairpin-helix domain-containing protein [Streptococcus massiliensis]SUN76816.1 putative competance protein [Streptococcus massiliensis]
MFEEILEKLKEYKLACGLILVGALLGGFFLLKGQSNQEKDSLENSKLEPQVELVSKEEKQSEKARTIIEESDSKSEPLTVDVKGAVKTPGVYELASGSRVRDAIQKAGGLAENADGKSINLAQKVADEAVIYVAHEGEEAPNVTTQETKTEAGKQSSTGSGKSNLVNLNTASLTDLQSVSGIGAKRAQDIIDYREANGKFSSVDDLKNVSGIGAKTLEKLKTYVTVD